MSTNTFESTLRAPPSSSDEAFSLPVAQPCSSSKPLPPRAALTSDQQDKLDRLIEHFNARDFRLPSMLKDLKQLWIQQGKETASRFGGLFGGSKAGATVDEVRL